MSKYIFKVLPLQHLEKINLFSWHRTKGRTAPSLSLRCLDKPFGSLLKLFICRQKTIFSTPSVDTFQCFFWHNKFHFVGVDGKKNMSKVNFLKRKLNFHYSLNELRSPPLNNVFPSRLIFCTGGAAEETSSKFAWISLKITILLFNKTFLANYALIFAIFQ